MDIISLSCHTSRWLVQQEMKKKGKSKTFEVIIYLIVGKSLT